METLSQQLIEYKNLIIAFVFLLTGYVMGRTSAKGYLIEPKEDKTKAASVDEVFTPDTDRGYITDELPGPDGFSEDEETPKRIPTI